MKATRTKIVLGPQKSSIELVGAARMKSRCLTAFVEMRENHALPLTPHFPLKNSEQELTPYHSDD